MPYREEGSDSFVSDIFGRIMISIMPRTTIKTLPESIRERKFLIALTAARTQLRRWEPATDKDKVAVAPSGFVFDLPEGLTMRGVVDRLGKLGFRHAFEVQRFARNCAVFCDDRMRELMSKVSAFVRNLFVLAGQGATRQGPIENKPSCPSKARQRRLLYGSRINPELVAI